MEVMGFEGSLSLFASGRRVERKGVCGVLL